MYLANKVQNIQGSADTLLDLAGIEQDEIRPVAEAMERGGRLAAKEQVTDAILDKCKPIAGTPDDCIAAIEEYKDAGCTHVMLELWGEDRHEQIRLFGEQRAMGRGSPRADPLFGEQVLPHVRRDRAMLVRARSRITRYTPDEVGDDVLLVDLRSNDERARDGIIPGSVHVPRSVLEWRCDQESGYANPAARRPAARARLRARLLVESRCRVAGRARRRRRRRSRRRVRGVVRSRAARRARRPSRTGTPGMGGPQ